MPSRYPRALHGICAWFAVLCAIATFPTHLHAASGSGSSIRGFREVTSAPGVTLYKRGRDYVQVVRPAEGAALSLLMGTSVPSDGDRPLYKRATASDWWEEWSTGESRAFSVTNGQFFDTHIPGRSAVAFSVKIKGRTYPGYADTSEYEGKKRVLLIGSGSYDIVRYEDDPAFLLRRPESDAIVGLVPEAPKTPSRRIGRTFIGVSDDGRAFVYTSPGATQRFVTRMLLSMGAGRQKILMLDGGQSTQLVVRGRPVLTSARDESDGAGMRPVPNAIGIVSGRAHEPHALSPE